MSLTNLLQFESVIWEVQIKLKHVIDQAFNVHTAFYFIKQYFDLQHFTSKERLIHTFNSEFYFQDS